MTSISGGGDDKIIRYLETHKIPGIRSNSKSDSISSALPTIKGILDGKNAKYFER